MKFQFQFIYHYKVALIPSSNKTKQQLKLLLALYQNRYTWSQSILDQRKSLNRKVFWLTSSLSFTWKQLPLGNKQLGICKQVKLLILNFIVQLYPYLCQTSLKSIVPRGWFIQRYQHTALSPHIVVFLLTFSRQFLNFVCKWASLLDHCFLLISSSFSALGTMCLMTLFVAFVE